MSWTRCTSQTLGYVQLQHAHAKQRSWIKFTKRLQNVRLYINDEVNKQFKVFPSFSDRGVTPQYVLPLRIGEQNSRIRSIVAKDWDIVLAKKQVLVVSVLIRPWCPMCTGDMELIIDLKQPWLFWYTHQISLYHQAISQLTAKTVLVAELGIQKTSPIGIYTSRI